MHDEYIKNSDFVLKSVVLKQNSERPETKSVIKNGAGYGVAVDNSTSEKTYMKMGRPL